VTATFTVSNLVTMNFVTPSTITLRTASEQAPNQGTSITIGSVEINRALLAEAAPVLTYTRTTNGFNQSFSNDTTQVAAGTRFFLTPDGDPNNIGSLFVGQKSVTITDPAQLALYTGSGTFGLPVSATAGNAFSTTSGNGSGSIITRAGVRVELSYTYVVPEPSSVALLGLGGGGILLAGGLRRRRRAVI